MPAVRAVVGRYGEQLVAERLVAQGWRLLARNWRSPSAEAPGELDLVAEEPDGTVVVIEVKTRRGRGSTALEAVDAAKLRRLRRLAGVWCQVQRPTGPPGAERGLRLDVVAVQLRPGRDPEFSHLRGVG